MSEYSPSEHLKQRWKDPKFREHVRSRLLGRKATVAQREKMRNAKLGEKNNRYGVKLTPEHIKKLIEGNKRRKYPHKEEHPNWRGGKESPGRIAARKNSKARRRNAKGKIKIGEWEELKRIYGNKCLCCGKKEGEIKLTLDHIIPIVQGGENKINNAQPLCQSCNSKKNRYYRDYRPLNMRKIKPINNNILIRPKTYEAFISSQKEAYEEVGVVLEVADGITEVKPNDEVFFDSWVAGKYPAEKDSFFWLVNLADIKAVNKEIDV